MKACILRVAGTNCDAETKRAFEEVGIKAEIIHFNKILRNKNLLFDYQILAIPGGFSYGDYVRAGAIWGKRIIAKLKDILKEYLKEGNLIIGICNGFQVLIEAKLLPGLDFDVALAPNKPPGFRCMWTYLRCFNNKSPFSCEISKDKALKMPIAHGEGRFLLSKENQEKYLETLIDNEQIVFRYCKPNGKEANEKFPYNPNGSLYDVAGICNPEGNVLGMMPHPERALYNWQLPNWEVAEGYGDGYLIFKSVAKYLKIG